MNTEQILTVMILACSADMGPGHFSVIESTTNSSVLLTKQLELGHATEQGFQVHQQIWCLDGAVKPDLKLTEMLWWNLIERCE